jgi:hypothetical protein
VTERVSWSYLARRPNGEIAGACVDFGNCRTGFYVACWIRAGMTVERVPSDWLIAHVGTKDVFWERRQ